jgi:hypothetical protein
MASDRYEKWTEEENKLDWFTQKNLQSRPSKYGNFGNLFHLEILTFQTFLVMKNWGLVAKSPKSLLS